MLKLISEFFDVLSFFIAKQNFCLKVKSHLPLFVLYIRMGNKEITRSNQRLGCVFEIHMKSEINSRSILILLD